MTTTANTTNGIATEARNNMDTLMARLGLYFSETPEAKALARAWMNEVEIEKIAKRIERYVEQAKRNLDEALGYVQTNHPEGLNPYGILQSINHDLDRAVAELRIRLGDRKWYAELLG